MIHSVRANQPDFRSVNFTAGVNLVLADRSRRAGEKDTTNALGKSTLIDIIDFCLGSNATKGKGLRVEALHDWAFTLEIDIAGRTVFVSRSVASPQTVVVDGDTDGWPIQPVIKGGYRSFDVKRWRALLAWAMFGLGTPPSAGGYHPSARSLLSYFNRNQSAAYISPFKYFGNQKTWDVQVHNAFLLGLNWEKAATWQKFKDQKKALTTLKQAIKTGAVDGELATLGELEAERLRFSTQLEREQAALSSFKVLPQYREIEVKANSLTAEIHSLINTNIAEKRRLQRYKDAIEKEASPADSRLEALYREAGISLPGMVTKTLENAREFSKKIVANRREFIADEISALESATHEREILIENLTETRSNYLSALEGQGALEELTQLQLLHATTKAKVAELAHRITQLRKMASRSDEIKVDTVKLKRSAEVDYEERRELWSHALKLFSEFSENLYKTPGRLVIDIADTGYKFDVEIAGSPSEGIGKMKIFCYDLMLVSFARQRGLGIDFLIHDSTIFDGVDPRQRAHALELAAKMAKIHGFQYICTLNTDMVPAGDFTPGFNFEELVKLRLTDTDPRGSLLGFRF